MQADKPYPPVNDISSARCLQAPGPIGAFLIVAAVLILRRPDAVTNPQFWAEDAVIFFSNAFHCSSPATLIRDYGGYYHLVPRVVAYVSVRLLEPEWIPLSYNVVTILGCTTSIWLFTLRRFRFLIGSDWVRLGASCFFAGMHPSFELVTNLTNLHWWLTAGCLLALFMPTYSRLEAAAVAGLQVLTGLSSPWPVLLAPLAAVVLFLKPRRCRVVALSLIAAVTLNSLSVQLFVERKPMNLSVPTLQTGLDILHAAAACLFWGKSPALWLVSQSHALSLWLVAGVLGALALAIAATQPARSIRNILILTVMAYLLFAWSVLPPLLRELPAWISMDLLKGFHGRFLFLPFAGLVFLVAVLCDRGLASGRLPARLVVFVSVALVTCCAYFFGVRQDPTYKDHRWREQVAQARAAGWNGDFLVNPDGWSLRFDSNQRK